MVRRTGTTTPVTDDPILNTAPTNTEEARAQSLRMLELQSGEGLSPDPSQEDADNIKLGLPRTDYEGVETRSAASEAEGGDTGRARYRNRATSTSTE